LNPDTAAAAAAASTSELWALLLSPRGMCTEGVSPFSGTAARLLREDFVTLNPPTTNDLEEEEEAATVEGVAAAAAAASEEDEAPKGGGRGTFSERLPKISKILETASSPEFLLPLLCTSPK